MAGPPKFGLCLNWETKHPASLLWAHWCISHAKQKKWKPFETMCFAPSGSSVDFDTLKTTHGGQCIAAAAGGMHKADLVISKHAMMTLGWKANAFCSWQCLQQNCCLQMLQVDGETSNKHHPCWDCLTVHRAKSYKPFELFVNENYKLLNELKQMWHLREVWLKIRQRDPLSAEMNDASAWRIGVSVVWFVVTLFATTACVTPSKTKRLLGVLWRLKHAAIVLCGRLILATFSLLSWAMFFTACEWQS